MSLSNNSVSIIICYKGTTKEKSRTITPIGKLYPGATSCPFPLVLVMASKNMRNAEYDQNTDIFKYTPLPNNFAHLDPAVGFKSITCCGVLTTPIICTNPIVPPTTKLYATSSIPVANCNVSQSDSVPTIGSATNVAAPVNLVSSTIGTASSTNKPILSFTNLAAAITIAPQVVGSIFPSILSAIKNVPGSQANPTIEFDSIIDNNTPLTQHEYMSEYQFQNKIWKIRKDIINLAQIRSNIQYDSHLSIYDYNQPFKSISMFASITTNGQSYFNKCWMYGLAFCMMADLLNIQCLHHAICLDCYDENKTMNGYIYNLVIVVINYYEQFVSKNCNNKCDGNEYQFECQNHGNYLPLSKYGSYENTIGVGYNNPAEHVYVNRLLYYMQTKVNLVEINVGYEVCDNISTYNTQYNYLLQLKEGHYWFHFKQNDNHNIITNFNHLSFDSAEIDSANIDAWDNRRDLPKFVTPAIDTSCQSTLFNSQHNQLNDKINKWDNRNDLPKFSTQNIIDNHDYQKDNRPVNRSITDDTQNAYIGINNLYNQCDSSITQDIKDYSNTDHFYSNNNIAISYNQQNNNYIVPDYDYNYEKLTNESPISSLVGFPWVIQS